MNTLTQIANKLYQYIKEIYDWIFGCKPNVVKDEDLLTDQRINELIDQSQTTDKTKKEYKRINSIITTKLWEEPKTMWWVLHHPDQFFQQYKIFSLTANRGKPYSLSSDKHFHFHYKAIFTLPGVIDILGFDLRGEWLKGAMIASAELENNHLENKPTYKQHEGFVPYLEIVKIRNKLLDGDINKLFLMMYTDIPPVRYDYPFIRILSNDNKYDDEIDDGTIDLQKRELVILKYKNKEHFGTLKIPLTDQIMEQLEISLKKLPRTHLFTNCDGTLYESVGDWSKHFNKVLVRLTGNKAISISMLRHIYCTHFYNDQSVSPERRAEIAIIMGHSLESQRQYMLEIPKKMKIELKKK